MKGIYLLQMDDSPTTDTKTEDPLISLNAITGLSSTDTMQLDARVEDDTLGALIDSGSTHSFISTAAMSRVHLDPLPRPDLSVKVANGDRVATTSICRTVHVFIDAEEFVIDLFVILLDGYNMVLGVQWLRTLGLILWDFARARMSYWSDDDRVVWQGSVKRHVTPVAQSMVATYLLPLLLEEFTDVFTTLKGLPPPRRDNHRIYLLLEMMPVAFRPYLYLQLDKD
jgi:hypothetical protein